MEGQAAPQRGWYLLCVFPYANVCLDFLRITDWGCDGLGGDDKD